MISSVVLVAPPASWKDELGVAIAPTSIATEPWFQQTRPTGMVVFADRLSENEVSLLVKKIKAAQFSWILVHNKPQDPSIWNWLKIKVPLKIVSSQATEAITAAVEYLIEHQQLVDQEQQRQNLMSEQNFRLKQLNRDLEARVERRQKSLAKAKERLLSANQQIETMHAASLAIQKARSLGELESSLTDALRLYLRVTNTRIRFSSQSSVVSTQMASSNNQIYQIPLSISGKPVGDLTVLRDGHDPFSEEDQHLLQQIADAVAMGVDRLGKFEQAEILKQQWQATFDSISEPLCLVDNNFNILRTNKGFTVVTGQDFRQLLNRNCFACFFGHDAAEYFEPHQRNPFKIRYNRQQGDTYSTFEVSAHPLHFESLASEVTLVMFRDITNRMQLERQLLETSKMAELGLIGSSIAHELNNPLGGMLSFIQLIRMDLKGNEEYLDDVREMEQAANRCRDIVQNLLGFARRSDTSDRRDMDLREVLEQALKITELQTRSQGVVVEVHNPEEPLPIHCQPNQLSQALCNLVQNATEAVLEKRRQDPRAMGKIEIFLKTLTDSYELSITDTGVGIVPEVQQKIFNPLFSTKSTNLNAGLGLTMAYKIISEHNGKLEISSQPGVGTTAKISFARLDLHSTSQVFDSKI